MADGITEVLFADILFLLQEEVRNTVLLASSNQLDSLFELSVSSDDVAVISPSIELDDVAVISPNIELDDGCDDATACVEEHPIQDNEAMQSVFAAVSEQAGVALDVVLEVAIKATSKLKGTLCEELAAVERVETTIGC